MSAPMSPRPGYARMTTVTEPKPVSCWLSDMDGVLVHEEHALPGGPDFIEALQRHGRRFWF